MLDLEPAARMPGYTGHAPGIVSECLIGRSYAYITGFRKDLMGSSQANMSEYKRAVATGSMHTHKLHSHNETHSRSQMLKFKY